MKWFSLIVSVALCLGAGSAEPFLGGLTGGLSNGLTGGLTGGLTSGLTGGLTSGLTNGLANGASQMRAVAINTAKNPVSTLKSTVSTVSNLAIDASSSIMKTISSGAVELGLNSFVLQLKIFTGALGKTTIPIPGLQKKAGPVNFEASGGYFGDLSSLMIAGKPTVDLNGTSIVITAPFKLNNIRAGYKTITVSMMSMDASGGMGLQIANNTIVLKLRLTPGLTCALNLERVAITEFSGIQIQFTNMGPKSTWVLDKTTNFILGQVQGTLKNKLQEQIDLNIRKFLSENGSICSKFLG